VVKIDFYGGNALAKVLYHYGFPNDGEKIVCPFHEDVNPSMLVNLDEGSCYCFGCNKSYNPIQFVKEIEKVDDLSACLKMADILKSEKVKNINVARVKRFKPSSKHTMHADAANLLQAKYNSKLAECRVFCACNTQSH
jgi:DNA primase